MKSKSLKILKVFKDMKCIFNLIYLFAKDSKELGTPLTQESNERLTDK